MKILVTGGLGFIGHHLVAKLESEGHEVSIVDNLTNYGIIDPHELQALHTERLTCIKTTDIYNVDILSKNQLLNLFDDIKPDVVIHCAAYPRAKAVDSNPEVGVAVLTTGLINLLSCSEQYNVRRFVYISSSMVYGSFDLYGYEDMACNPTGTYSILKLAGEQLTQDWCKRAGIDHVVIRPSAVYGERDVTDRVVSKFITAAIRNEELVVRGEKEVLDFTYVSDAVNGIAKASTNFSSSGRVYNVTRGNTRTLLEAAELAIAIAGGGKIRLLEADPRYPSRGGFSNIRAGQDFGYHGTVDIEEGFRNYYDWLKKE